MKPNTAPVDRQALQHAYSSALESYLRAPEEHGLHKAADLGRLALHEGLSPLDLVALHEYAIERSPSTLFAADGRADGRAIAFLLESLSPFEATYRQFLEANVALRGLNDALETESRRTARLIHDGAGQILFSLQLALAELVAALPRRWKPQVDRAMQLADQLDQQLRSLSRDLYPVALDDLGLNAAVRHLLDGVSTRVGLTVSFHSTVPDRLPSPVAVGLYRVIHEGVSNVVRHAHATELAVSMDRTVSGIVCTVSDNGIGVAHRDGRPSGLGLRGIRDRLTGLDGDLAVNSAPGHGTQLVITIPVRFKEQSDGNQSTDR